MSDAEEAMYTSMILDERLIAMREYGYTDAEISRLTGTPVPSIRRRVGKRGRRPKETKKVMRGISVSPKRYDAAKAIALRLGLSQRTGKAVGEGSVGRLVEEIGAGRVVVRKANDEDLADFWLHLPDGKGRTVSDGSGDDGDGEVDAPEEGQDFGVVLPVVPLREAGDYEEQATRVDRTHPEAL